MNIVKSKNHIPNSIPKILVEFILTYKRLFFYFCTTVVGEKQSNAFAFSRYQKVKATGLLMYYNLLWWPLKTKDSTARGHVL